MAFLLALALVVSVMSGLGLSVSAEQESNTPGTEEVQQQDKTEAGAAPSEGKAEEEAAKPKEKPVQEEKEDEQKKQEETKTDDAAKDDANAQNGDQKDEPQAEPAAEEPAEPEGKTSASYLSTLSVEELYAYLTKLDDNNFAAAWKELTDSQKAEYNAYVLKMTFGDNKTTTSYEGGGAAASMTNVAGLVSNLAASQKALRNSPARAARAAVQAAKDVELSNDAVEPVNGLHMNKWITKKEPNTDGTDYIIHLESYTTGKTTTTYSSKPCDIVLVLDQSGSMAWPFKKVTYTEKKFEDTALNSEAYKYKDSLYVKGPDGTHIKVSLVQENDGTYIDWNREERTGRSWKNEQDIENYYYKTDAGYKRMESVERKSRGSSTYIYTYDGGHFESNERITLYKQTTQTKYKYTYSYTYNGKTETTTITGEDNATVVPSKTRNNDFFVDGIEKQLYYAEKSTNDEYTRLDGLKDAVNQFVSSVESDATTSGVDHNIAIVGYASPNDNQGNYNNTEVLTGVKISTGSTNHGTQPNTDQNYYFPTGYTKNGVQYGSSGYTNTVKQKALQSAKTDVGQKNISDAINALTAYGGTKTDDGMAMASDIFANQTQKRKDEYASGERNKIVVLFTDGVPTGSSSYWNNDVANSAIDKAKKLKADKTTIYTIGIFNGADATAAIGYENPNQYTTDRLGQKKQIADDATKQTKCANTFMHYVSSNYPNATSMTSSGTAAAKKGYYLTAADSAALNEIFSKIASEIGSSDVALNATTQTIDKMSAEFKLPDNVDASKVKVYEVPCTGVNADGSYTFGAKTELKEAVVSINKDAGTVSVSGFDYSKKYINKDSTANIKGYKLLIEFPVEYKNDAWFGGNDIESNDIGSGIYNGGSCYGTFEVPKVNRAIDYEIAAKDQTIYVTNQADLKELLAYPTKAGTDDNYKPDGIKNRYVNITYTLKDATGKEVGTYTIQAGQTATQGTWASADGQVWNPALEDCTEYTWTCTVKPISEGDGALGIDGLPNNPAKETPCGSANGTVHVLYPTVEVKDEKIYWGETVTLDNLVKVADTWKDRSSHTDIPNARAPKPTVTVTSTWAAGDNSTTPEKDGAYKVTVKVGTKDVTSVVREMKGITNTNPVQHTVWNCDDHEAVDRKTYDFCIHVKSKKLTVIKEVKGNMGDTNQDFDFTGTNVYGENSSFTLKDGNQKSFKLKVGETATITETEAAGYETTIAADANVGAVNASNLTYTYKVERTSPDAVTVTFTNTKTINPPNGITTTIAPYAIMVVLAAGAGVYFVYSRRRRNH